MVGEMFEIYLSQMAKSTLKLSTMVGENFEIYYSLIAKETLENVHDNEKTRQEILINEN